MKMKILLLFVILAMITGTAFIRRPKQTVRVATGAKAGDMTLEDCEFKTKTRTYRADCGTLIVPENRRSPGSRLIALPLTRIHAESKLPLEPIFYLGGGPGASNMGFIPPDGLLATHDIVLVGYRGVDGSSKLDCPEYSKAVLGNGTDVLGDESLRMMSEAIEQCFARFDASGVDLGGYTIEQVVQDLEAARVAFGYEKINLLSESYGTRVAQVYSYLHAVSLKRSAMIGVNPPGRFVWEPQMIDTQIAYYGQLWAKDSARGSRASDLSATMKSISQNMPKRWLFLPIDPGKVNAVAFVLLFHRNTSALVFDSYVSAANGDPSGLALMSLAYDFVIPKAFVWGDLFVKGGSADFTPRRDYVDSLRAPDTILGSPVAYLIWAPLSQAFPENIRNTETYRARETDVETLLISGSVDFSTPAEYATNELLPSLKNGKQVVLAEMGHVSDVWNVQPEATTHLLKGFYADGTVDDSLYQYEPMNFKVSFGFPLLAKLLVSVGILFGVVLAFGLRKTARRLGWGSSFSSTGA